MAAPTPASQPPAESGSEPDSEPGSESGVESSSESGSASSSESGSQFGVESSAGPGEGFRSADLRVRLVVLFGGQSAEHDVSCVSARHVLAAADPARYLIEPIGIDRGGQWLRPAGTFDADDLPARLTVEGTPLEPMAALAGAPGAAGSAETAGSPGPATPTVVFPALHGPMGEDGTIQGLLELAGVAYVGAGVLASALCMDKVAAKAHLSASGVAQGNHIWLDTETESAPSAAQRAESTLGLPVFVKPANMGSSVGVSRATTIDEVEAAIQLAGTYDRTVIIEEEIRGREIEVAVLGNEDPLASVPGEIVPGAEFYDYADKYDDGAELRVPAPLQPEETEAVQAMAIAAYRALRVEGLARVDFFYETSQPNRANESRGWLVNELNTMPGFTPISMYPKLWAESGLAYPALIDRLVDLAIERHQRQSRHRNTTH